MNFFHFTDKNQRLIRPPYAVIGVGESVEFTCLNEEATWIFRTGSFGSHYIKQEGSHSILNVTNAQLSDAGKYTCMYEENYFITYGNVKLSVIGRLNQLPTVVFKATSKAFNMYDDILVKVFMMEIMKCYIIL